MLPSLCSLCVLFRRTYVVIQLLRFGYSGNNHFNVTCLNTTEIQELAEHGITIPPNMQGLTDDQILDLKLRDEWQDTCIPSGGAEFKKDEIGRRNGNGEATMIILRYTKRVNITALRGGVSKHMATQVRVVLRTVVSCCQLTVRNREREISSDFVLESKFMGKYI